MNYYRCRECNMTYKSKSKLRMCGECGGNLVSLCPNSNCRYNNKRVCGRDYCIKLDCVYERGYLDELEPFLKACGIDYKRGPRRVPMSNEDGTSLMKNAVAESNANKSDIHYVSHTNGTAKGYRPMVYPGSAKGKEIAGYVIAWRKQIYPYEIKLNERADLYELNSTHTPSYYEEHVFHDNPDDAKWFHENMRKIAEYTCRAFCDYFGMTFINPYLKQGDIDGDGTVTAQDALTALQAAVSKITLTDEKAHRADTDSDGKVSATDALNILKDSVGKWNCISLSPLINQVGKTVLIDWISSIFTHSKYNNCSVFVPKHRFFVDSMRVYA